MTIEVLCETCQGWILHYFGVGKPHTIASAKQAAQSGCGICRSALNQICKRVGDIDSSVAELPVLMRSRGMSRDRYDLNLEVSLPRAEDETESRLSFDYTIVKKENLSVNLDISGRGPTDLLSPDISQCAQKWLSDCRSTHEKCRNNSRAAPYPTRLLKLGESAVRLILPGEEKGLSGPYAALSYCWGPNPTFLRLSAESMNKFRTGIPYSDLPTAFHEAAQFVKSLSILYLWIDSLCVIQYGPGSDEDWRLESAKMHEVYSNCAVNISLSEASHPGQSCLSNWPADVTRPFEIEISHPGSGDERPIRDRFVVYGKDHRQAFDELHLNTRGWVLQEHFLAPRILTFGLGQLFWSCAQLPGASESFPAGTEMFGKVYKSIPTTFNNNRALYDTWTTILEDYTARELTFPEKDKLVAVSAVATHIGNTLKNTYISGHFLETLPWCLEWRVEDLFSEKPKRARKRARKMRGLRLPQTDGRQATAPSWSWASIDGCVYPSFRSHYQSAVRSMTAKLVAHTSTPIFDSHPVGWDTLVIWTPECAKITWAKGARECLKVLPYPNNIDIEFDDQTKELDDGTELLFATLQKYGYSTGLILKRFDGGFGLKNLAEIDGIIFGEGIYERVGYFQRSSSDSDALSCGSQERRTWRRKGIAYKWKERTQEWEERTLVLV